MHLRLWLAFAATSTISTGCPSDPPLVESGGDDDDSGDETGAPTTEPGPEPEPLVVVPLADFFVKAEEALCAWQVECNAYGGMGRCQAVTHFDSRLSIAELAGVGSSDPLTPGYIGAAVEMGRIEYDEAAAVACLNYVAARSCDYTMYHVWTEEELVGRAACEQVFKGTMGKNGPCNTALECEEVAVCGFNPACTDMCCPGACRVLAAPIPTGEACGVNPNARCEEGTYCGVNATCEVLPTAGQNCDIPYECGDESRCRYDESEGFSRCVARAEEGGDCQYYDDCQVGLTCILDENYEGTCVVPGDVGEPCVLGFESFRTCRRIDNYCDPDTLTCTVLPGKDGSCVNAECRGDFFCVEGAGYKCSPVADEGEHCGYMQGEYIPCSGDSQCRYSEDFGEQTCVAPSASQCPPPEDTLGG